MQNIVVQVERKYAVLLNGTGDFVRIKNKGYTVGQRLETGTRKRQTVWAKWAAVAVAAFVMLLGGSAYAYYTPYVEYSVDVNPSIEFTTNIFDRVIDVKAMNEDAEQLLQRIRLKDCDLKTAVSTLIGELIEEGYLSDDAIAELVVTASSKDQTRTQTKLHEMIQEMDKEMTQNHVSANIQGECAGEELKTRAQEYGVTPGKLMLAERYAQSTGDPAGVDIEEWLGKSVKEIMAALNENQEQHQNQHENSYGSSEENGAADDTGNGEGKQNEQAAENGQANSAQNGQGSNAGNSENGKQNETANKGETGKQNGTGSGNAENPQGNNAGDGKQQQGETTGNGNGQ